MKYLSEWVILLTMAIILLQSLANAQDQTIIQDTLNYGSKVVPHDVDEGQALSPFYIGPEFAFVDLNNNGIIEPDEPVYIHIDPTVPRVSENDVRITWFGSFSPGSKVMATDPDHGKEIKKFGMGHIPAAEIR